MSMKELNSIYAFGYGLFIYSPGTFNEWMQERKCRAKKMLSYLDKHKDMFFEMIAKGIALPIYQIPTERYPILITTEESINIPAEWEEVFRYEDWFITIGANDKLCFSSFEFFEEHRDLIAKSQCVFTGEVFDINDNPHLFYHSDEIQMPKGNYRFDIYGLKRKQPCPTTDVENRNRNYAYLFAFRKVDNDSNENLERCDNETHIFSIEKYLEEVHNKER